MNNYYEKMSEIYRRLQDEESRKLFEARVSYMIDQDLDEWVDMIAKLYDDWYPSAELEERMEKISPKGIILYGCGYCGKMTMKMLRFWGYEVSFFCDTYEYGHMVGGKKVLSSEEVAENYRDYLIITASYDHGKAMYDNLVEKGFDESYIYYPWHGILMGTRGRQYFDVFPPVKDEIFVDAGSYDGQTVLDFCDWTSRTYKKIYAFEPINDTCRMLKTKLGELKNVVIYNHAAWNKKEELHFTESGSNSNVSSTGEAIVQGLDIDSAVKDDKVTFIKMDIEGSELKALEGSKNTIRKNKPRLAICIYHKPMDVIELASYILELVPEYKFYIRHYTSHMWETVLYAVI